MVGHTLLITEGTGRAGQAVRHILSTRERVVCVGRAGFLRLVEGAVEAGVTFTWHDYTGRALFTRWTEVTFPDMSSTLLIDDPIRITVRWVGGSWSRQAQSSLHKTINNSLLQ